MLIWSRLTEFEMQIENIIHIVYYNSNKVWEVLSNEEKGRISANLSAEHPLQKLHNEKKSNMNILICMILRGIENTARRMLQIEY